MENKNSKKITFFIASLSSGGAEHQLVELSSLLIEKGYDVTIVTFVDVEDHYNVDARLKRIRLGIHKSRIRKLLAIYKYFALGRFDTIISFTARCNFIMLSSLFFRRGIRAIVSERCTIFKPLVWYEKINYSILYRKAKWIVPNSYTQRDYIIKNYPRYKGNLKVITNYTDSNLYASFPLPHNKQKLIGVFCRFSEQKNYKRFAEMLRKLKNDAPNKFKIIWYGNIKKKNSDNPDYIEFKRLIELMNVADIIELKNHVANVHELLPLFDALCLPSIGEGFSNSISEYICAGRPVLAGDVADNHHMVHNGKNGFLFNPFDINDMEKAFLKYLSLSDDVLDYMGEESRKIALTLFDKENFVQEYIKLLQ